MKKSVLFGAIISCLMILVLVFSATALAQQKAGNDFKWPPMFRIATPTTQSASFASTNGWAPLLRNDTGVNIRVVPEDSELRRYMRFAISKEFEMASISIADGAASMEGQDGYKTQRAMPTRILWFQNDTPWSFVVRGDSDIKTVYDLKKKGVRVALSTQSPPMMVAVQEALPAFLGWTKEEAAANWTFVPAGSYPDNCRSITDGRADVAYVTPISSITFEMEAHPRGLRWLALPLDDKAGWQRFMDFRPTVIPVTMDFGVKSALGVDGLASAFLYYTRPDLDQEMVYRVAKWLHESFDDYKDVHAIAKRMSLDHFRKFLNHNPYPVAEGTIRYLREIGQWTEADDQWNNDAIALQERWIAARNAALDEAEAKKVKVHFEEPEFLAIFKKHTEGIPVFTTRLD
ncbi:TAXI family TRAP transporter solute-binding subunit [Desulfatitalea alkaliphila]|uniref:TAXI family TRAP transporter solute-binding subunit n=1 Tax=Desulfatitalea alkaliphila TaxID=2929485 RepID=A0AA41R0M7_9BACT|nr:TAXI family TRAP transporter solute-binding subunit [Desulfatitalea alkaliphila]MCJ8499957.1 TAXI family TRAP transporter solute-binding subunit [Desulfatitalea alkaliphila]